MPPSLLPLLYLITTIYLYPLSTALPPSRFNTTTNSSSTNAVRTMCAGPWDTTHLNNGPMLMQQHDCMAAFLYDFTPTATVYQSLGNVHFYDGRTAPPSGVGVGDGVTFQLPWRVRRGSCTIITTLRSTIPLTINGHLMSIMFPSPRGPASDRSQDYDTFAELYNGVSVIMGACTLEPMLPRAGFAIAGMDRKIGIMVVGTGSTADVVVGDAGAGGWGGGVDVD